MANEYSWSPEEVTDVLERAGHAWQVRLRPAVEASLQALPEEDEDLVQLLYVFQASNEEAAALLRIPEGREGIAVRRREILGTLAEDTWAASLNADQIDRVLSMAGEAFRLEAIASLPEPAQGQAQQVLAQVVPARSGSHLVHAAENRPPQPRLRRWMPQLRAGTLAALALVVAYGGLWVAGRATLSETYALASVDSFADDLQMAVRSDAAAESGLAEGAQALLNAPTTTLGLFPRYRSMEVEEAILHFERAFAEADDPFLRARAAFFAAKAHLMHADPDAARLWLDRVLAQDVALYRDEALALREAL